MLKLKIPPPVYFLLFAAVMWLLARDWPVLHWLPPPWNYTGLVLMLGAALLGVWSLVLFVKSHTTVNPLHPEKTKTLVTDGLYRYTRNPMYIGLLVMLIGWAIYLGSLTPFFVLPAFVWLITQLQILPEEQMLSEKFGQAYQDFLQRVPRWLW